VSDAADLYFELPIGYAVEVRGEVVRSADGVVVVRFVDPPKEAVVAMRAFCRISGELPFQASDARARG
jgi:hypothetical protein